MLARIAIFIAAPLSAGPGVPAVPNDARLQGCCFYAPDLPKPAGGESRLGCTDVTIEGGTIIFSNSEWGPTGTFSGIWQGDNMVVERFAARRQQAEQARGSCHIWHNDGAISAVACTAATRGRSWVANFLTSRI